MNIFSKSLYDRRVGEPLSSYFTRTLIASSISYLVLGIPTLAIIGIMKGIPLERFLIPRAVYLYFAVIIGSILGRLVRGKFNKVENGGK